MHLLAWWITAMWRQGQFLAVLHFYWSGENTEERRAAWEDWNFAFKQQRMNKLSARQQFLLRSRRDSNYCILFMAISSAVSLNNISIAFPKQWNKVLPFEFVTKNNNNNNFKVHYLFLFFNHRITINSDSSKLRRTL